MTKKIALLILCVFAMVSACWGSTDPAGKKLLVEALQQANIFSADASPFELEVDFKMQIQVPEQGHLIFMWESTNRWWRKISVAALDEIDIRKADRLYTLRNAPFTPVRVNELTGLIDLWSDTKELQVKKVKRVMDKGVEVACLEVHEVDGEKTKHEICLNPGSHELLSDQWDKSPDDRRREEYSDYFEFRGHRYPRVISLFVNGSRVIEAHVARLVTAPLDEQLLVPPPKAIERRQCESMKHAVPVKTPDPRYPESAKQNGLIGDTVVSMTVLADGSVDNIQLVGSSTHAMDDATLQVLKTWKFKPAMCGTEPVVSDIRVIVRFRLE